jgi:predicted alpha/beta superfamily hydrolase
MKHLKNTLQAASATICLLLSLNQAFAFTSGQPGRREIKETLPSRLLGEERTVVVSLPGNYGTDSGDCAVLFVLDAEHRKGWMEILRTVEGQHAAGHTPQMIVVGIWNTERNRDMIPVAVSHRPGSGGSLRFLDFLTEELIPHIQEIYRTSGLNALYGGSNAGLFTVYALLQRPDAFGAYIASSPMIGHCPDFIQEKAEAFAHRTGVDERILYMVYGDRDSARVTDFVPGFRDFMRQNAADAVRIGLDILEGEGHVPDSGLARGLRFVFTRADSPLVLGKRPR